MDNKTQTPPATPQILQGGVLLPKPKIHKIPSSPALFHATGIIGKGKDFLTHFQNDKKEISHNEEITYKKTDEGINIVIKSGENITDLTFGDLDIIKNTKGPAAAIFIFLLEKCLEQALDNGQLIRGFIQFSLGELMHNDMYSSNRAGRSGLIKAIKQLQKLWIGGEAHYGKKEYKAQGDILFFSYTIENNLCNVYLNPNVNWSFICQFYLGLPHSYYSIPAVHSRAKELVFYISQRGRQLMTQIKRTGYFDITYKAIGSRLGVKDHRKEYERIKGEGKITRGRNNYRDIISDGIIKNVEIAQQYDKGECFTIEPHHDKNASFDDVYSKGFLRVYPKGDFLKEILRYENKKDTATKRRIKKIENRREKALLEAEIRKTTAQNCADGAEKDKAI